MRRMALALITMSGLSACASLRAHPPVADLSVRGNHFVFVEVGTEVPIQFTYTGAEPKTQIGDTFSYVLYVGGEALGLTQRQTFIRSLDFFRVSTSAYMYYIQKRMDQNLGQGYTADESRNGSVTVEAHVDVYQNRTLIGRSQSLRLILSCTPCIY